MADNLSTEELLLLENLMYMTQPPMAALQPGDTIGNVVERAMANLLTSGENADYGTYMSKQDWENILTAVSKDENLMNMNIATTHRDNADGGGGGYSAVFVNPDSKEAVVAFRGTALNEWKDDFTAGGDVSSKQQQNALDWYQEAYKECGLDDYYVTVTGHSKGGNKAKYITVLDGSVDRCVSFDGQGFSDEFMENYKDQIEQRQYKIENNNVDYDYVNLLLNDIGNTTYYKGYEYGEGGFLENHCPNTFFNFSEDGKFSLVPSPTGQGKEMKALDEFLNSYLRSLSPKQKVEALALIGELVEEGFKGNTDIIMEMIQEQENQDTLAYLLAYLIEYEQANPEFADEVSGIMKEFGMEDYVKYVDMVKEVLNSKYFDLIVDGINVVGDHIPDWVYKKLLDLIKDKFGIELTLEQLKMILHCVNEVNNDMNEITIKNHTGADIAIDSKSFGTIGLIRMDDRSFQTSASDLLGITKQMSEVSDAVLRIKNSLGPEKLFEKAAMRGTLKKMENQQILVKKLSELLETLQTDYYNATEQSNTARFEN